MATIHNLGYPRIGANRELKFALESYWKGACSRSSLRHLAGELRTQHWQAQRGLDWVPVGDFSFYDQVLDTSFMLGNIPARALGVQGDHLDRYFRVARGRSSLAIEGEVAIAAAEMSKWFDTNYHYIVPEFTAQTHFSLDASRLVDQWVQAKSQNVRAKPVIIGPLSYLALGKTQDGSDKLELLPKLLRVYGQLLDKLAESGVEWVQIDEPLLVTEISTAWLYAFKEAYQQLSHSQVKIMLTTYFDALLENKPLAVSLPVAGLHVDAVNGSVEDVQALIGMLPKDKVLSVGVISGRNIWKTDLNVALDWLEPISSQLGDRLWLAPSCSLLHVPVDLESEVALDTDVKGYLAFACQKLEELRVLGMALQHGRAFVQQALTDNAAACRDRLTSPRVRHCHMRAMEIYRRADIAQRQSPYRERAVKQAEILKLPLLPSTTIGSFPQTSNIRQARRAYKSGAMPWLMYQEAMRIEIAHCLREQEALGLDVLVHGEAERNDMVEYFAEQLEGYAVSQHGWVQSYGSRCVKPPILFGHIRRLHAMTVDWIAYAQSLTTRPMKGMLTGPVTMLNWSFVRDDLPRAETCLQLAWAIRQEVLDLEAAGIKIIQIDEAALREGLPLRRAKWRAYLAWAVNAFRVSANGVKDETQIHTHMCYSEFNDIIEAIADMDADVITIETSRSKMELLDVFERFQYPNGIGPGVYDIHSPNIPSSDDILALLTKAAECIPIDRLWVNPDCGLKTRNWDEVRLALQQMVNAAKTMRLKYSKRQ